MKSRRGVTTAQVSVIAIIVAIVAAGGTAAFFVGQPQKVQTVTEVKTQVQTQVKEITKTEVKTLRKVQFQIGWLNEYPNRIGWWVGIDKGYFREEGIDLEIVTGKGAAYTTQIIVGGQALIGEGGAEPMVAAVNKGVDLVAIWSFHQRDPNSYFVKPDSGINSPKDFVGKKVGVQIATYGYVIHQALLQQFGVKKEQIEEIPEGFDPCAPLAQNQMDVTVGFSDNAVVCKDKGIPVRTLLQADFGFPGYGPVVYVKRETLEKERDLLVGFVRGTIKGWDYAIKNPEEAVNIFLKFFPNVKREVVRETHEITIAQVQSEDTKNNALGWMSEKVWGSRMDLLVKYRFLDVRPDISKIFTNELIKLAVQKR